MTTSPPQHQLVLDALGTRQKMIDQLTAVLSEMNKEISIKNDTISTLRQINTLLQQVIKIQNNQNESLTKKLGVAAAEWAICHNTISSISDLLDSSKQSFEAKTVKIKQTHENAIKLSNKRTEQQTKIDLIVNTETEFLQSPLVTGSKIPVPNASLNVIDGVLTEESSDFRESLAQVMDFTSVLEGMSRFEIKELSTKEHLLSQLQEKEKISNERDSVIDTHIAVLREKNETGERSFNEIQLLIQNSDSHIQPPGNIAEDQLYKIPETQTTAGQQLYDQLQRRHTEVTDLQASDEDTNFSGDNPAGGPPAPPPPPPPPATFFGVGKLTEETLFSTDLGTRNLQDARTLRLEAKQRFTSISRGFGSLVKPYIPTIDRDDQGKALYDIESINNDIKNHLDKINNRSKQSYWSPLSWNAESASLVKRTIYDSYFVSKIHKVLKNETEVDLFSDASIAHRKTLGIFPHSQLLPPSESKKVSFKIRDYSDQSIIDTCTRIRLNQTDVLSLSNLSFTRDGVTDLCTAMMFSSTLKTIKLGNIPLPVKFTQQLATHITSCPTLTKISLIHCNLKDTSVVYLAKAFRRLKNIASIDLSHNPLGDSGISALARYFIRHLPNYNVDPTEPILAAKYADDDDSISMKSGNNVVQRPVPILTESNLVSLSLRDCEFGPLGLANLLHELESHSKLKNLVLSQNTISATGLFPVGDLLSSSTCLNSLDLSDCQLTCGVSSTAHPFLHFSRGIFKNSSLTSLNLSRNPGVGPDSLLPLLFAVAGPDILLQLQGVVEEKLAYGLANKIWRGLTSIPEFDDYEDAHDLYKDFSDPPHPINSLRSLDLSSNKIDGSKADLITLFMTKSLLESLSLWDNPLGISGCSAIAPAFGSAASPTLTVLNLRNVGLDKVGAEIIADSLLSSNSLKLVSLDLSGNNLGASGVKSIAYGLQHSQSIHTINFAGNKMGDHGVEGISLLLLSRNKNKSIRNLNLSLNRISDAGARVLGSGLKSNTYLASLDLSWNFIGAKGIKDFASSLKDNYTLSSLNLEGNRITSEGFKTLLFYCAFNSGLSSLNISGNALRARGANFLSKFLQASTVTSMTQIIANNNEFGNEGAESLATGLKTNTTVKNLSIAGNLISAQGAEALSEAIRLNPHLRSVDLTDNPIFAGAGGLDVLHQAQERNPLCQVIFDDLSLWNDSSANSSANAVNGKKSNNKSSGASSSQ